MENTIPILMSVKDFIEKLNSASTTPIGLKAVYHFIQQPGFPSIMIGNRLYIMIEYVKNWMLEQANKKQTQNLFETMSDEDC